jgi:hypothetical protein
MIQNVSEYIFLGSLIKSNGNLNHSLEDLAKKAKKVLFSIKSRVSSLRNIPIKVSNNIFDKLVQPVLTIMKCFMGNLPSSALTPIFEDVFLAPKVNLQKFK